MAKNEINMRVSISNTKATDAFMRGIEHLNLAMGDWYVSHKIRKAIECFEDAIRHLEIERCESREPSLVLQSINLWHRNQLRHECCEAESGECSLCAILDCPHADPMHYHHDGCPSCWSETQDAKARPQTQDGF